MNLLRSRAGFGSGAQLAEAADIAPSIVNNIIRGKTKRLHTDTRNAIETATGVPLGTLQRVAEDGRPAEVVLEEVVSGEAAQSPVAYRSGQQNAEHHAAQLLARDAELEQARRVMEQRETAFLTVGRSVGRLGHEVVTDPDLQPHPDIVVRTSDGETVVVEVAGGLGHDLDEDVTSIVGEQARWRAAGVDRVIVFAYVDWPEPVVKEIGRFGVEYAGSQAELEQLLGGK